MLTSEDIMKIAIEEALIGVTEADEVPIGAVIMRGDEVIARTHNRKETNVCAVYHAEIVAIMEACQKLGTWRLDECDLYVTLEPCSMCAGAMINSRIRALYFGAYDPKAGCCGSLYNLPVDYRFNHRLQVSGGIMKKECGRILTDYFRQKRIDKKPQA